MLVYFAVLGIVAIVLGYRGAELWLLTVMGFNMFLNYLILYLRSNIAGLHLFKTDSLLSVLDRGLMILFCGIALWNPNTAPQFTITTFVYIQTLCYVITAIVTFAVVMRKAKFKRLKWSKVFFLMILRKSFPFAILVLLMAFYNRVDAVMIERLLKNETGLGNGDVQSGIYASAYRLLDAANMIAYLVAGVLLPMFARFIGQNDRKSIEDLVKIASMLLLAPAVVVAFACYFYSFEIMGLLYKQYTWHAAHIFRMLMGCFAAFATTYVFGTLLTANGNLRYLNTMAVCGIVLNLTLNFILIPRYFAYGAAIASFVTQYILAGVQAYMAYRIFKLNLNYNLLIRFALFFILVALSAYGSRRLTTEWMFNLGVLLVTSGILIFATGIINIKQVIKLVGTKTQ